ncbi:LLM class flavin-dependent oxidoreductase [Roseomonas elaeocarpi]
MRVVQALELGLDTFGDVTADDASGGSAAGAAEAIPTPHAQVIRDVVAEAVLADEVGVDVFGLGEHHRADYAVSAPEVVLGAIAGQTRRMRLGTAVTVLSSDDPVRVFQRFSTLDALSGGRAEVILGRGSFTESFPLFGYELRDYERLFEEKLELFSLLRKGGPVTWQGSTRAALEAQPVFPPVENGALRTWIGAGGSPESVVRAAHYDLPLMLAIIGGDPARFRQHVELHERAYRHYERTPQPIGVHSPGHVADTDAEAREALWPAYKQHHDQIGSERGWPPMQRADFERECDRGSLYVGAPDTVARKIAATVRTLGLARFDLKYSHGRLSHARMMRGIELYGRRVIPMVRELLAEG